MAGLSIRIDGANFALEYGDKKIEGPLADIDWVRFSRRGDRGSFYLKMQEGKALSAPTLHGAPLLDSAQQLATRAGQVAMLRLYPKVKNGNELDLGAVKVSKETMRVKTLLGFKALPLSK